MSTRRKKAPAGYKSQRKEPETDNDTDSDESTPGALVADSSDDEDDRAFRQQRRDDHVDHQIDLGDTGTECRGRDDD